MSRSISPLEFKRLLFDIRDRRPDVRVRIRLMGKMWGESFCAIESVNDDAVILIDSYKTVKVRVPNLNEVVQFELECSFFGYQAFYHYQVVEQIALEQATMPQPFQNTGSFPTNGII